MTVAIGAGGHGGNMLVSVIMPMYNSAPWVAESIESLRKQTHTDWELIVVDDGSTDASPEIVSAYTDERVLLIRGEHQGPSVARNLGLKHSHGAYLQFLDADDLLAPDKLALQLERLNHSRSLVASCEWYRFHESVDDADGGPEPVWADLSPVDWVVTSAMGGGMMATAAWLVPREVAERAGPWSPVRSPNDDGEYFNRVRLASDGIVFVANAKVFYRSNIGGWSGVRSRQAVEGLFHSLSSIEQHLLAAEDSPRTRCAIATNYARFIYDTFPDHGDLIARAEQRVKALGGSPLGPPSGGLFGRVARVTGWRTARRIQRLARGR